MNQVSGISLMSKALPGPVIYARLPVCTLDREHRTIER